MVAQSVTGLKTLLGDEMMNWTKFAREGGGGGAGGGGEGEVGGEGLGGGSAGGLGGLGGGGVGDGGNGDGGLLPHCGKVYVYKPELKGTEKVPTFEAVPASWPHALAPACCVKLVFKLSPKSSFRTSLLKPLRSAGGQTLPEEQTQNPFAAAPGLKMLKVLVSGLQV